MQVSRCSVFLRLEDARTVGKNYVWFVVSKALFRGDEEVRGDFVVGEFLWGEGFFGFGRGGRNRGKGAFFWSYF